VPSGELAWNNSWARYVILLSFSDIGLKTIWIFQEEPTTSDIFFKFYNDNGDSWISIFDNFIKVTIFFFLNKISNHGFTFSWLQGQWFLRNSIYLWLGNGLWRDRANTSVLFVPFWSRPEENSIYSNCTTGPMVSIWPCKFSVKLPSKVNTPKRKQTQMKICYSRKKIQWYDFPWWNLELDNVLIFVRFLT